MLATCAFEHPTPSVSPVVPTHAEVAEASFVDPTAQLTGTENITMSCKSYVAPFASLSARRGGSIKIGEGANVQDNVTIDATSGRVEIGNHAIVAHNAWIRSVGSLPARIGSLSDTAKPSFVGFNADVSGATLEEDTMVLHLAKVAPGITLHSGMKVLPGKAVWTQRQADDPRLGKVAPLTQADRDFMHGVLEVNEAFAAEYTDMYYGADGPGGVEHPELVNGIASNPSTSFNPVSNLPDLAQGGSNPQNNVNNGAFRNRVIGNVSLAQDLATLDRVMESRISIRADEGDDSQSFRIGTIKRMLTSVTMHALEHTGIVVGDNVWYGYHSLIHGGEDTFNYPTDTTQIGNNVVIGDYAVVFRSTIGNGITIGAKTLIDGSQLLVVGKHIYADYNGDGIADKKLISGTVIPANTVIINNEIVGRVEW